MIIAQMTRLTSTVRLIRAALVILTIPLMIGHVRAQDKNIDSLKNLVLTTEGDTAKVNAMIDLGKSIFASDPALAIKIGNQSLDLATKLEYREGIAYSLKNLGLAYYMHGDYPKVMDYWERSLTTFVSIGDKLGESNILNNLGAVYFNRGDDASAIDYYLKSLEVSEELGDKLRIGTALTNIAGVYANNDETFDKSLEYNLKALEELKDIRDHDAVATVCVNIGEIYYKTGIYTSALEYLEKSLNAYDLGSGDIAYTLNTLGKVYAAKQEYLLAIEHQTEAYEYSTSIDDKLEMTRAQLGLGSTYMLQNEIQLAHTSFKNAETLAIDIGANYELKDAYEGLSATYSMLGNYKKAHEYQTLVTDTRDDLFNAERKKIITGLQPHFDLEKKQAQIDLLTKESELHRAKIQKQQAIKIALIAGLLLIVAISILMYWNYQLKSMSNKILQKQNAKIIAADLELNQSLGRIKVAYETLEKNELKLLEAKVEAEKANRIKSAFLANVSHEIRTPLNGIIGFTDLIMKTKLNNKQSQYSSTINQSALTLLEIVNDVLDFSKLEAGKFELLRRMTNLQSFIADVSEMIRYQVEVKKIRFIQTIDNDLPQRVFIDDVRLRQVIINLLGNGIKFTERGEIEIKVEALDNNEDHCNGTKSSGKRIKTNSCIRFSVRDTGIGISPEKQKKVFEAFNQGASDTSQIYGGTGLGLSISNKLLALMGSQLKVESKPGKGSTFYFDLCMDTSDSESSSLELQDIEDDNSTLNGIKVEHPYKILIADDNEVNLELAKIFVQELIPNAEILEAHNGKEAVNQFIGQNIDLVLMDVQMPDTNGFDATREIRKQEKEYAMEGSGQINKVPIIAMTAGAVVEENELYFLAGMDDYMQKPITSRLMKKVLESWI